MANSFTGTFTTPAKEAEFMAITDDVAVGQFRYETGLTSISLPEVISIRSNAFQGCPLTSLSIPKVKAIGDAAFADSNLSSLDLPEVQNIGINAFFQSPLTTLNIPEILILRNDAFFGAHLTSLSIPKAQSIGEQAFVNSELTTLNIPNAVTIGIGAFRFSPLTTLNIPNAGIIGNVAFEKIINAPTTTVTMPSKFNTNSEKDRIFGAGHWDRISFNQPIPIVGNRVIWNGKICDTQFDWNGKTVAKFIWNGKECILKSKQPTITWRSHSITTQQITCGATSANGQHIVVGTYEGIVYWSHDRGQTWSSKNLNIGVSLKVFWDAKISDDGRYMYLTNNDGRIYYSINSGGGWNYKTLFNYRSNLTEVYFDMSPDGRYLIATQKGTDKLMYSVDFAYKWIPRNALEPNAIGNPSVSKDGKYMIAPMGKKLLLSSNFGTSFDYASVRERTDITSTAMSASGSFMLAGKLGFDGIGTSKNSGVDWRDYYTNGFNQVKGIKTSNDGSVTIFVGNDGKAQQIFAWDGDFSTNPPKTPIAGTITKNGISLSGDGVRAIVGNDQGKTLISFNGGITWIDGPVYGGVISRVAVSEDGSTFLIVGQGGEIKIGTI